MSRGFIIMNEIRRYSYTITHPQKGIWYTEKIYPGTSLYNIGGSIRIRGRIDLRILEEAIHIFIERNEGLRLTFFEEYGEVKQYIEEYTRTKLDFLDFSQYVSPEKAFTEL